jgi:uncharacterized protein (DUF983 family)
MSGVAGARRSTADKMISPAPAGSKGQPAVVQAALFGLCPACGAKTMFVGILRFANRCNACDLDFTAGNVGDGPAALLMLPLGALVVAGALFLHFALGASWWVQLLVWPPLTTLLAIFGLRVGKAALLALEHQRSAKEGRRL